MLSGFFGPRTLMVKGDRSPMKMVGESSSLSLALFLNLVQVRRYGDLQVEGASKDPLA